MSQTQALVRTMKQSRQLVTHGHITINDQKVTIPSYVVSRDEEELIAYHPSSKLNDENHVLREIIDGRASEATFEEVSDESNEEEGA